MIDNVADVKVYGLEGSGEHFRELEHTVNENGTVTVAVDGSKCRVCVEYRYTHQDDD